MGLRLRVVDSGHIDKWYYVTMEYRGFSKYYHTAYSDTSIEKAIINCKVEFRDMFPSEIRLLG